MINKLYCSFSQMKGLLYSDWFDGILNHDLRPPVGAGIDLTDACNLRCSWCNSKPFRSSNKLSLEHVKKIVDMLAEWGVKSVCYAGGGEPTLHPDYAEILKYTFYKGLEVGTSTNGTLLSEKNISAIVNYCTFCGISFDAGTKTTWTNIKKSRLYDDLIQNCTLLLRASEATDLDLTFKMVISEDNQHEILTAAKLAKDLGFMNFFIRPAAFENIIPGQSKMSFDIESIQKQITDCAGLEDTNFAVYGNFGRVDKDLCKIHRFETCLATPLFGMFCADGYCYLCIDYRQRPYGKLVKHLDLRDFWGSNKHWQIINNIDIKNCPRCTFGNYNEQMEHYKNDMFFRWFP